MKLLTPSLRRSWKVYDWIFLALLLSAGVWTSRVALFEMWRIGMGREEQSYILLAPFVAAWLFWLRRSRLPSMRVEFNLIGPTVVFIGWFANYFGIQRDIEIASHTGAMLMLLGCVMSMRQMGDTIDELRKVLWIRSLLPKEFDPAIEPTVTYDWKQKRTTMTVSSGEDNSVTIPWMEWEFDKMQQGPVNHLSNWISNYSFEERIYRLKKGEKNIKPPLPKDQTNEYGGVNYHSRGWKYGPEKLKVELGIRRAMGLPLTLEEFNETS